MTKRKRVPLKLNGTDEQYFRTKDITGLPPAPKSEEVAKPTQNDDPRAERAVQKKPMARPAQNVDVSQDTEIVSRIVHLGIPLTRRLHDTAQTHDVPIDDLLYAARKKAIKRLRRTLSIARKPILSTFEKGGETMRIAVSLSGTELGQLRDWFDPIDIGIATKAISPLITDAFRIEVDAICKSGR